MHPRFLTSSLLAFALFFPALLVAYLIQLGRPVDMSAFLRLWVVTAISFASTYAVRGDFGNG